MSVGRAGDPCQVSPAGTVCPRCRDEAWPTVASSPIAVSMSSTTFSPTTAPAPIVTAPVRMRPSWARWVARKRVLADQRARPDGQQVGAHGHVLGEQHGALADPCSQGPEIERVDRRAREQHEGVRAHQRLHDPEAQVGDAPDRELPRPPAADEQPLQRDRQERQDGEAEGADGHGPHVEVPLVGRHDHPPEGPGRDGRGQVGVAEEEQQLGRTAQRRRRAARPGASGARPRRSPGRAPWSWRGRGRRRGSPWWGGCRRP